MARVSVLFVALLLYGCSAQIPHNNPYDAIRGCQFYDAVRAYNETLDYFAIDSFRHVGRTPNSKYLRLGMVGRNDFILRLSRSRFPFSDIVTEIVIGGWANQESEGRRQTQRSNAVFNNVVLGHALTPNMLSRSRPFVIRLEVFDNGTIQLTKDGEQRPFFQFSGHDPLSTVYMALTKWDADVFYFYDCPLNDGGADAESILLKCTLS